jgi:hypothetical protein
VRLMWKNPMEKKTWQKFLCGANPRRNWPLDISAQRPIFRGNEFTNCTSETIKALLQIFDSIVSETLISYRRKTADA